MYSHVFTVYLILRVSKNVWLLTWAWSLPWTSSTCQVRPENPAEYSHDYMKQSQWVAGQSRCLPHFAIHLYAIIYNAECMLFCLYIIYKMCLTSVLCCPSVGRTRGTLICSSWWFIKILGSKILGPGGTKRPECLVSHPWHFALL